MKKFVLLTLVLAMVISMAACGCDHAAGDPQLISVDTTNLTIQWEVPCKDCGEVIETTESATGIAPVNGVMQLSPDEWFACLTTNIVQYGANQSLAPHSVESEDNALVQGIVSMAGMKAVISFWDPDGNTLTTEQREQRDITNSLCVEAQFTNDNVTDFYTMLMLFAITNNSELDLDGANALCSQIMAGDIVSDNGYSYSLAILSAENHTVALTITAE